MNSRIGIIIQREYLERVSKKSFIITTILMPVLFLVMMVLPTVIIAMGGTSQSEIVVYDRSGKIFQKLEGNDELKFIMTSTEIDSLMASKEYEAILLIPADVVENRSAKVRLYSNGPSSMIRESGMRNQINSIIKDYRLHEQNIEDLDKILAEAEGNITIDTVRTDKEEEEDALSSGISYGLGIAMSFVLYMFILIYGQMIMTSIIEEKNNRVLELVVSSIKPAQLMMGKIFGVSLVALTQILIWGVLIVSMVAFVIPAVMPSIMPADAMADIAAVQSGNFDSVEDAEAVGLIQGMLMLGNVWFVIKMFTVMTLFLLTGFLFYASIFAAIGSSVDNIQDASQLTTLATFPIIFSIVFAMIAAADPTSGLSFWTSIIPFTSPMVMVARVPYGIPGWEVVLSLVVLIASFIGMVWLAGKIYRVGIFMYGKKPTIKEIIRWTRYK